jgi:UDP:flavonoid glycosyltransferase YjiC (YdhE family)
MWFMMRSTANTMRKERLGMPSAPFFMPSNQPGIARGPVLYGFSPEVLPRSPDWGDDVEITGYWFADEPEGWTPPPALEQFIARGSKPVCIGFGSMSQRDPAATTRIVLDAIAQSGQRAILIAGWGGLKSNDLPENVFQIDSIHHSWLYPKMAAVVHHGGAGTTSAGLRAGVPSIVVPFHGDQPFWGKCIENLGVGPAPVPRNRLTAERLAKAIQIAVTDPSIATRAAEIGAKIRKEDGITRAVEAIERITKRGV